MNSFDRVLLVAIGKKLGITINTEIEEITGKVAFPKYPVQGDIYTACVEPYGTLTFIYGSGTPTEWALLSGNVTI